ncbi:MAG: hypothetical protein ACI8P0_004221 [Planctomycetaceae bacterium]|jgi:hypothetical protein
MQSPQFKDSALELDLPVVTSIGINRLKELPNIEALRFAAYPPVGRHLGTIGQLPRLRNLSLAFQPITDSELLDLENAEHLESLNLQWTRVTTRSFETLARFKELHTLKLGRLEEPTRRNGSLSAPDDSRSLLALRDLSKLRTLEISTDNVSEFGVFESFPELRTLKFTRVGARLISDFEIDHLSRLPMLHTLHLPRALKIEHAALFRQCMRLRVLWFRSGDVDRGDFETELKKDLPSVTTRIGTNRLLGALDDLTTGNFADTPLDDVMGYLARLHEIQIHIDEAALDEAGVSIQEPINLVLAGVSLGSLLNLMLNDFGLVAVPHNDVLTITTGRTGSVQQGSIGVYRRDYDLSDVIPNNETGDQLTESLAAALRKLVTPEIWGNTYPELPSEAAAEGRKATAEIATAGTTLSIIAPAHAHASIENVARQITLGKHSDLLNVEFAGMIDRSLQLRPENSAGAIAMFSDLPLTDAVEYLGRHFDSPIIIDVVDLEESGLLVDEPITQTFDLTTLSECLDTILKPLKLTWVYENEVIMINTQAEADNRPQLVVHQLFDELLAPDDLQLRAAWESRVGDICRAGLGISEPQYEIWLNRLIVHAPWQAQLKLARSLKKLKDVEH